MKQLLLLVIFALSFTPLKGGVPESERSWEGDKFSLFIHWGLYSELGGVWDGRRIERGYSEQIQSFAGIWSDYYEKVAAGFNPVKWSADSIVLMAKSAGMRSVVFTSKHHDGFSMYHTRHSKFNIVDATPFGRDPMKELSAACAKYGLNFGVYFSLIDWHFPAAYPTSSNNADPVTPEHHRFNMKQVEEILTQYGSVSELWFDMGSLTPEQSAELRALVKRLQPSCMISGRLGNNCGDFAVMADNEIPDYKIATPWQTAASMFPETWGYRSWQIRGDLNDKVNEKIQSLVSVVAKGGNYLLNIGPRGDGSVVEFEAEVLSKMGGWLKKYGKAIYGTSPVAETHSPAWGEVTVGKSSLFLFINSLPLDRKITLPPFRGKIEKVTVLGSETKLKVNKGGIVIPAEIKPDCGYIVIEVSFKGDFEILPPKEIAPINAFFSLDYYRSAREIVGYEWYHPVKKGDLLPVRLFTDPSTNENTTKLFIEGKHCPITPEMVRKVPLQNDPKGIEYSPSSESFTVLSNSYSRFVNNITSETEQELLFEVSISDFLVVKLNGETLLKKVYLRESNPPEEGQPKRELIPIKLKKGENSIEITLYNRYNHRLHYYFSLAPEQACYYILSQGGSSGKVLY